jgi:hypothetical protein
MYATSFQMSVPSLRPDVIQESRLITLSKMDLFLRSIERRLQMKFSMARKFLLRPLKVHKNENFVGFDFEFCTVSLLVMSKY